MDIKQKIKDNLQTQVNIRAAAEKAQQKFNELNTAMQRTQGAMATLAELFEEEFGLNLQQAFNQDPEWGQFINNLTPEDIDAAQNTAQSSANTASQAPSAVDNGTPKTHLRRVTDNKVVDVEPTEAQQFKQSQLEQLAQQESNQPQNQQQNQPPVVRKRQGVIVEIDDNPPGPGTPDKPDPS